MNPFSLYDHKPQVWQAAIVTIAALAAMGDRRWRFWAAIALAWAAFGLADYLVYAFAGPNAARSARDALEWCRFALLIPVALRILLRKRW